MGVWRVGGVWCGWRGCGECVCVGGGCVGVGDVWCVCMEHTIKAATHRQHY